MYIVSFLFVISFLFLGFRDEGVFRLGSWGIELGFVSLVLWVGLRDSGFGVGHLWGLLGLGFGFGVLCFAFRLPGLRFRA